MRQIETLLGYPKVGPLSPSAIAINLGAEEDTIQPDLDSVQPGVPVHPPTPLLPTLCADPSKDRGA
jgi:hypothetical protein